MACFVHDLKESFWLDCGPVLPTFVMSTSTKTKWCARMGWGVILFLAATVTALAAASEEIHLEVLKCGTSVYSNVTVYGKSDSDIFIRHAQGFGNLKISNLDQSTLRTLGLVKAEEPKSGSASETVANAAAKLNVGSMSDLKNTIEANSLRLSSTVRPSPAALAAVLLGLLLVWVFWCYCLKLICVKAGSETGLLVWLPGLQMIPLFRAAGMSGWWFLATPIPLLDLIVYLFWCVKIARARGKGIFTALLLMFPLTNLLALLYLAFSGGEAEGQDGSGGRHHDPAVMGHVLDGIPN